MTEFLSQKMLAALKFAAIAHRDQSRKDSQRSPYISHPAAVALILAQAGFPDEVVMAGVLHDVIEDTNFSFDDIQKAFGSHVAELVAEVSEDTKLGYDARKDGYLQKLEQDSPEACAISAADLLANMRDMLLNLDSGDDLWLRPPYNLDLDKKIERNNRRITIIKAKSDASFISELEQIAERLHKILIERSHN